MDTGLTFTSLLTASDPDLVRIFYRVKPDSGDDFILRINKIAAQLGLNHSQLVCALGFNRHIRGLTEIQSILGFSSYHSLMYRTHELFTTDAYKQLPIDNILDIYSEHLQDREILTALQQLLQPRLEYIQAAIAATEEPALTIAYRMEIYTIYTSGLADASFAESRLLQSIGHYRVLANEVGVVAQIGLLPPSNMFFMDTLVPEEKQHLIEHQSIKQAMIENRLKNPKISAAERDLLENYI